MKKKLSTLQLMKTITDLRAKNVSEEDINAGLRSNGYKMTASDVEAEASSWANFFRTAGQGLTFGFGDEIAAGVRSLGGEPYDQALKDEREGVEAYRTANPYKSMGVEALGALPTAVIPGLGQARAASIAGRLGNATLRGAIEGGIYGIGSGEGSAADRAVSGAYGAAGGAAGGGAMRGAQELFGPSISRIWARALGRSHEEQAARRAVQGIANDGGGADQAMAKAATVSPHRANDMVVGDLNEELSAATQALANKSGAGRVAMRDALVDREGNVGNRIVQMLRRYTRGDQELRGSFIDEYTSLSEGLKEVADPLYKKARAGVDLSMVQDELAEFADMPIVKKAKVEAKQLVKRGEKFNIKDGDLRTWDLIKQGLDAVYEKNLKPDGSPNKLAAHAAKTSSELLETLDAADVDGLYAAARQAYAGPAAIKSAMDLGYDFFRTNSAKKAGFSAKKIATMSHGERDAFARGIAYSVMDLAAESGDTANIARNIMRGQRSEALRKLFYSEDAYNAFKRELDDELRMFETSGTALRGSRTEPLAQAIKALDTRIGVGGQFTGEGFMSALINKIRGDAEELSRDRLYEHARKLLMTKVSDGDAVKKALTPDVIDNIYDGVKSLASTTAEKTARRGGARAGVEFQ